MRKSYLVGIVGAFVIGLGVGVVATQVAPTAHKLQSSIPSWQVIGTTLQNATLQGDAADYFVPKYNSLVTVSDGHGGTLTAVIGERAYGVTGDNQGYAVFFFHNQKFAGLGLSEAQHTIGGIKASGNKILVSYSEYRSTDPSCCPSLPDVQDSYLWNGSGLARIGQFPSQYGNAGKIILR